jgi:chemotaxis protein MotB
MALGRIRRGESGMNYWPGFVDALSTLILSIIFLLSVFLVVQFYLQQEVQGKNAALQKLNGQIAQLTDLLSMEKVGKANLEKQLGSLQATLASSQSERDKFKGLYEGAAAGAATAQGKVSELSGQLESEKGRLESEKGISAKAQAEVETLNGQIAALRQQLVALNSALDVSTKKETESQERISDLGQRLNVALAQHVQELSSYRSEFFGKLREILGNRPDMRIEGDRFVLQ